MRRFVPRLIAAALVVGLGIPGAVSTAAAQDTSAVAVNLQDGRSVFRLAFQVKRTMDTVVDNSNSAIAFASCDSCQTVAISLQVVLAMADTDEVTTENLALAYNYECSECDTLAAAYQYVFATGEPVRLTATGNQRVADIRRRLQMLRTEQLTLEELARRVDELADELGLVLQEELIARTPADQTEAEAAPAAGEPDGSTTTTTSDGGPAASTTSTTSDSTTTTEPSTTTTT